MNKSLRDESGVAALEFAMVITVIFGLLALTAPLGFLIQERVLLERVAGHAARFATAAPDRPRYGAVSRRPTVQEVRNEAVRAYKEIGGGTLDPGSVTLSADPRTVSPGQQIEISISQPVSLGALDILLVPAGIHLEDSVMIVNATSRQE